MAIRLFIIVVPHILEAIVEFYVVLFCNGYVRTYSVSHLLQSSFAMKSLRTGKGVKGVRLMR